MATRRLTWAGVTKIVTSFRSWRRSPNSRSSRSPARSNRVSRATAWFTAFSSGLDGVRPYSRRPSDASVETVSGSAGGWRSNCSRTRSGTSYPHRYTGASSSSATVALGAASALAAAEAWVSSNSPAAWVTGRSSRGSGTEQSRSTSSPVASDASTGSGSRVVRRRCTRSRSCASRRSLNVENPVPSACSTSTAVPYRCPGIHGSHSARHRPRRGLADHRGEPEPIPGVPRRDAVFTRWQASPLPARSA